MNIATNDNMRPWTSPRNADPLLEVALVNAGGDRKRATLRLLEALHINEGDSDLGGVIEKMLEAGVFYACRSREEYEQASEAADALECRCADLATKWRLSADHNAEGAA